MIIGILSDTHDKLATIDAAFEYFRKHSVSTIIHCGDWKTLDTVEYFAEKACEYQIPFKAVLGNNDESASQEILNYVQRAPGSFEVRAGVFEIEIAGRQIALYHGHHAPTLRKLENSLEYDIVCLGHTHKPKIHNTPNTLFINPGSTAFSIPRSRTWRPTVVLLDTDTLKASTNIIA